MLKIKPVALAVLGLVGTQAFAASGNAQQLQQEIQQISAQQAKLQAQVASLKAKLQDTKMSAPEKRMAFNKSSEKAVHAYSFVRLGSYLAQQFSFDGSELVINAPSVLESQDLLKQRYAQNIASKKAGFPEEDTPYMVLSGELEGQAIYSKSVGANSTSDIDLTDAELAMQIVASKWVNGLFSFEYDNDVNNYTTGNDRVANSRLFLDKAFITIGNLSESPFYGSVGQMYVPFGRYSYTTVSSPLTKLLFRTKARAVSLGYYQKADNGFAAHVYEFQATMGTSNQKNRLANWGVDADYHFSASNGLKGDAGAGYINNVASSQGMLSNGNTDPGSSTTQPFAGFGFGSSTYTLSKKVGGYDLHAKVHYNQFAILAEYVSAATAFNRNDLAFGNSTMSSYSGAKPKAFDLQGSYSFMAGHVPTALVLDYGFTRQALALRLPRTRYGATVNFDVWKDTIFSLEYRHDVDYDSNKGAAAEIPTGGPSSGAIITGGPSDNVITAQLDMYF